MRLSPRVVRAEREGDEQHQGRRQDAEDFVTTADIFGFRRDLPG
jgi:hypothetical protein